MIARALHRRLYQQTIDDVWGCSETAVAAMAEDATLLEGRKTKLELSKDATLCGTPKQQRNFIWVAFYALAITCGLVLRRASILRPRTARASTTSGTVG